MRAVRLVVIGTLVAGGLATVAPSPANAASRVAAAKCANGFAQLLPDERPVRAHSPATLPRPAGVRLPKTMRYVAVPTNQNVPKHRRVAYEPLAAPTGFTCSGVGNSEDDVSWATLRSPAHPAQTMTAHFMLGQGAFPAACAYALLAGRRQAAKKLAQQFGMTLRQCRKYTDDTPLSGHGHGVPLGWRAGAPFVVVFRAPAGSEYAGPFVRHDGKYAGGARHTRYATLSVAIMDYRSAQHYSWPQSFDCSLPRASARTCVAALRAFTSTTMARSFGMDAAHAAYAARRVAAALQR